MFMLDEFVLVIFFMKKSGGDWVNYVTNILVSLRLVDFFHKNVEQQVVVCLQYLWKEHKFTASHMNCNFSAAMATQKKMTILNKCGEKLVGVLHEAGSQKLVILCHGFRSSKVKRLLLLCKFSC